MTVQVTKSSLGLVKAVSLEAVIIRADGSREDLGRIAYHKASWLKILAAVLRNQIGAVLQVNTGRAIVTGRLQGTAQAVPQYGAWGTGAGTTGATDTTLFTEATEARVAATQSQQTTTTTNDTSRAVYTIIANAAKTITNAGLFDAASAGNLWLKGDFAGIPLGLNDSIQFTFNVQYA